VRGGAPEAPVPWLEPRIAHFEDGGLFEDAERSPAVSWSDPGPHVVSYAIVLEDVDASAPRVHWCLFDLPEKLRSLPADVGSEPEVAGGKQARNDFGRIGYLGPTPGHRHRFLLYGVTKKLGLAAGVSAREVLAGVVGNVSQVAIRTASAPVEAPWGVRAA
jgi:Raf kinase inhibitor-like YbhB/YbcL family protein